MQETVRIADVSVQQLCMLDLKRFARYTTGDEQIELAKLYRADGNPETRNLLVRTGTMWAVKLAGQFARRYGAHCFFMDLVQEAMMGLMRAAELFDPTLEIRFSTYATHWIRQKMYRFMCNHAEDIRLPVHRIVALSKYRYLAAKLQREYGREATDEEMVAAGLSKGDLRNAKFTRQVYNGTVSLETKVFEGKDGKGKLLLDVLADPRQSEELLRHAFSDRACGQIASYLRMRFKYRQAEAVIGYFGLDTGESGATLEEVGKKLGITRERVRQLIAKTLESPSFRWYVAKALSAEELFDRRKAEEIVHRLSEQQRLAAEAAAVPAVPELRSPRRQKANGSHLGATLVVQAVSRRKPKAPIPAEQQVAAMQIIAAAEKHYALPEGTLVGPSRNQYVSYARKVAAQLIREKTALSWDDIGSLFNRLGVFFNSASLEMRRNFQENPGARESFAQIRSSVMGAPS